jgi:hypothetical protein
MALDTLDFWVGTLLIVVLAFVQSVLYGWILGIERGHEELHRGAHIRIPRFVQFMLKFVVPVYLLAILVGVAINNGPGYARQLADNQVALISVLFIAVVTVFITLLVHIAGRRWEAEGRYATLTKEDVR